MRGRLRAGARRRYSRHMPDDLTHLELAELDDIRSTDMRPADYGEAADKAVAAGHRLISQIDPSRGTGARWCSPDGWFFVEDARIAHPDVVPSSVGAYTPPPSDAVSFAAWRRSDLPAEIPAYVTTAPAWCCSAFGRGEVRRSRVDLRALFSARGVTHYWLVDVEARVLEALVLDGGLWRELGAYGIGDRVRVAPFGDREIDLSAVFEQPLQPVCGVVRE